MNIAHIISSSRMYGAENMLINIAGLSKANGDKPQIICLLNRGKPMPEIYEEAGKYGVTASVVYCDSKLDIKAIWKIRSIIKKEKTRIIHTHGYKSNMYGLIVSKITKIPVVSTLHGWTSETSAVRFYQRLDKKVMGWLDYVVTVVSLGDNELSRFGLNKKKSGFIPNGIDVQKFNPYGNFSDLRKKYNLERCLVVGTVGRLSPEKAQINLIKAFKNIYHAFSNLRVIIVGEGPLMNELKEENAKLGLEDKVIFMGEQKDMVSVYKMMDIFVLPSITEGMPMALLEAMSMELPVIATKVGAIPSIIVDGEGIIVEPNNCGVLESAIDNLLRDVKLRREMGKQARQNIINNYSIETSFSQYLNLYENILAHNVKCQ